MEESSVQVLGMRMSRRARTNFRWDFIACISYALFNVVFNQFYIPIAMRAGANDLQVGILSAAPAIGLLFSPLWASLAERGSTKTFFIYPNLVGRLLVFIPALFVSPWLFVGIALAYQMLMGIQAPAYAKLMADVYPADIRGRVMGYVRVAMGVLMIPLSILVGVWIDRSGSLSPLLAAALTGAASVLLVFKFKEKRVPVPTTDTAPKRLPLKDQLRFVLERRPLMLFLAATTLSGFGNMLAGPLYNIIQVDHLQLTGQELGVVRMAYFILLLLAYSTMGWLLDRYSPRVVMVVCMTCQLVAPLLYGFIGTYPAVIAASGLQGLADASWDLGCMVYVFRLAPGREGIVFGLHLMLFGIRGTVGPLLSTGLNGIVPMEVLLTGAALFALLGILTIWREKSSAPHTLAAGESVSG